MGLVKFLFRVTTGVLTLVIIALIGVIGYFTWDAMQRAGKAEQAGWFTPKPDGATPLNLFEQTASKAMFGKSWNSSGFPCRSVAREWVGNIDGWKQTGGQPVSQILARDIGFDLEGTRSLTDGMRKIALACTLESRYSDAELLRMWTRRISFAEGVVGAEAASQAMFRKPVAALEEKQAATLVALLEAPNLFRSRDKLDVQAQGVLKRVSQDR